MRPHPARGRAGLYLSPIGLEADDAERRKSLAEKGWARRAVVVRGMGPCGVSRTWSICLGAEEYYYGGKYTYRSYNVPRSYGTVK